MDIDLACTEPQAKFHALTCKYPLFVGGFGSGKTEGLLNQAFLDASHSPNAMIALYEPTFDLVDLVLAPRLIEKLDTYGIPHNYNKTKHTIYTRQKKKQFGNFILRSLDKPERIVAYQAYRAHVDEIDTIPYKKSSVLWNKIIGRTRQIPQGFTKHNVNNRVCAYTTPEGFNFAHRRWVKDKSKNPEYDYVKASSLSNPFLPRSYIESLMNTYTPELASAYIHGEFVNLTSGTVYSHYNRSVHESKESIQPKEPLYIGLDFNVTRQAATIYVKRPFKNANNQIEYYTWHAVDELVDMYDTPEAIRVIKERYEHHPITIYPDASGGSRKTVDASISDIALLRQAGFTIKAHKANPMVKDRILATNTAFTKGYLFINSEKCPTVTECLEQQSYDDNGQPDKKAGNDHQNDATTYVIAYELPVRKPVAAIDLTFMTKG